MKSIEILSKPTEELKNIADTWTTLTTVDISYTALWHQRRRYEITVTLVCNDDDRQAGPMRARKDFKPTTKILTSVQEQGRQKSFVPKNERIRQRPFDDALRAELEWMSEKAQRVFCLRSEANRCFLCHDDVQTERES